MDDKQVTILGAGAMGTALSVCIANKGYNVNLWVRRSELYEKILTSRENPEYHPGVKIPQNVNPISDINDERIYDSNIIFLAIPSSAMQDVIDNISRHISRDKIIVNVAKAIMYPPPKRVSELLYEKLGLDAVILSGPNFAQELIQGTPSITVLASKDHNLLLSVKQVLESDLFVVELTDDVVGVEICGVMKGIISISIGIADALGLGDNTRGILFSEGLREMQNICKALGGKIETVLGPAGVGDLATTAFSLKSRNRAIGFMLGFGLSRKTTTNMLKDIVVEGARSILAIREIACSKNLQMPLVDSLYEILYKQRTPRYVIFELCTKYVRAQH